MINWLNAWSWGRLSSILQNAVIRPKNLIVPWFISDFFKASVRINSLFITLKIGFFERSAHCGSCWKASSSMKVWAHKSTSVSSSCGWKTLTRKSSRKEVKVLMTISEPDGTTSLSRVRKSREGGRRMPILKTLGSTSNLCPVALPSCIALLVFAEMPLALFESDTSPGTDDFKINSRSSLSAASSVDLTSISDSLNILYEVLVTKGWQRWKISLHLFAITLVLLENAPTRGLTLTGSVRKVTVGCKVVMKKRTYLEPKLNRKRVTYVWKAHFTLVKFP